MVHALLPRFLKSYAKNLPDSTIEEDIESRSEFEQYQYLERAIEVVRELGYEAAIRMYADHPGKFKELRDLVWRPGTISMCLDRLAVRCCPGSRLHLLGLRPSPPYKPKEELLQPTKRCQELFLCSRLSTATEPTEKGS